MRWKLLATALGLMGVGASAAVVAQAGEICVRSNQQRLSPVKMFRWAIATAKAGRKTDCDILTFESSGGKTEAVLFPVLRFRRGFTTIRYLIEFESNGSGKVFRQVLQAELDQDEIRTRSIGPVLRIHDRPASSAGALAFSRVMHRLSPLRAAAVATQPNSNFLSQDVQKAENSTDGPPEPPQFHKCLSEATHQDYMRVDFRSNDKRAYWSFATVGMCADAYSQAARDRIDDAQEMAFQALNFRPPEQPWP